MIWCVRACVREYLVARLAVTRPQPDGLVEVGLARGPVQAQRRLEAQIAKLSDARTGKTTNRQLNGTLHTARSTR